MAGLINDQTGAAQMAPAAQATTTNATAGQATATNATATGYDPAKANAASYNATTGNAANAALATNTVDGKQTVAGQLKDIMSDNSPLLQQARANSLQQANSRGLVNSSMAQSGADAAVLSTALPIAQQDATTYFQNGTNTAAATNQNSQYNATNQQDMTKTNLGFTNSASAANAANEQQTNLANQNATNTASQFGAAAQNAASSQNAQQATAVSQSNAQNQTAVSQGNAQAANSTSQFNATASNNQALAQMDNDLKAYLDTQDNANKITLQAMDGATKTTLANIQAQYQEALQSSQSASDIYKTIVGNISSIMTNKDMDASAKQTAVNQQTALLQSGLKVAGAVSNVDLSSLLDFDLSASVPQPDWSGGGLHSTYVPPWADINTSGASGGPGGPGGGGSN
jgi:hypothetical protein